MPSNTWSEDETLMAFVLYLLLPKSACNARNPEVQKLARAIGRTPDSVKMKMWNISL